MLASVFPEPKLLVQVWSLSVRSHEVGLGVGVGLKLEGQLAQVVAPPSPPLQGTRVEVWVTLELWTGWGWGVPSMCQACAGPLMWLSRMPGLGWGGAAPCAGGAQNMF